MGIITRPICYHIYVYMYHIYVSYVCYGLFAPPLDVTGRLWSVFVAISGHLLYCFTLNG